MAYEEASVAGETPDRSKQRKSSGNPTAADPSVPAPEERDPRLAVAREVPAARKDQATAVFSTKAVSEGRGGASGGDASEGAAASGGDASEGAVASGGDERLRDAVAAWVAGSDDENPEADPEDSRTSGASAGSDGPAEAGGRIAAGDSAAGGVSVKGDASGTGDASGQGDASAEGDASGKNGASGRDQAPAADDASSEGVGSAGRDASAQAASAKGDAAKPVLTEGDAPAKAAPAKSDASATEGAASAATADAKPAGDATPSGDATSGAKAKPGSDAKSDEATKPGDDARAPADAKPGSGAKSDEATESGDDGKAPAWAKPAGDAKPAADAKSTSGAKSDEATKPGGDGKAPAWAKPAGGAKPAADAKSTSGAKSGEVTKSGDDGKAPAWAKPAGDAKSDEAAKPAADAKPSADAESKPGSDPKAKTDAPKATGVDQATAVFKAPRVPEVDQPTTMLKLGGEAPAKGDAKGDAKSDAKGGAKAERDAERTSKFVALKPLDEPAGKTAPKAAPGAKPAAEGGSKAEAKATAEPATPGGAPAPPPVERTTQQPLPPKPPLDLLAELTNTPPPPETPVRTAVRRVKIWTPIVLLLVVVFAVVQAVRPLPTPTLKLTAEQSVSFGGDKPSMPWPSQGQAAMDVNGIGSFGTSGDQKPVPIASIAKVMTVYVILRDHPLKKGEDGPKIPVDAAAEKHYETGKAEQESVVRVAEGQKITQYEALQAVMLPSANNIAKLLARWDSKSGSEDAFVAKMNKTAKELGMKNTRYTDPSGLDKTTVSTAEDLVKLGRAAMKDPVFNEISRQPSYKDLNGEKQNNFFGLVPTVAIGIKTGTTTAAGGNILFAAEKKVGGETQTIIGAALGQFGKNGVANIDEVTGVTRKLIEAGQDALTAKTIVKKGDVVGHVDDGLGGTTPVVATKDVSAVGWPGLTVKLHMTEPKGKPVPHTAKAGTEVGVLSVGDGKGDAIKVPVALQKDLAEPGLGAKLRRVG
ncbi:D-alanyl-D-alanine carboxypeptidase [Streptomyces sp. NPDC015345]|uniref:D-alanyl-D-alanine carboxypeptidase n=1 Tax=Streptomyces sp. NPDC015345 TaxID=3364953 RepID=UPI0036FCD61D